MLLVAPDSERTPEMRSSCSPLQEAAAAVKGGAPDYGCQPYSSNYHTSSAQHLSVQGVKGGQNTGSKLRPRFYFVSKAPLCFDLLMTVTHRACLRISGESLTSRV